MRTCKALPKPRASVGRLRCSSRVAAAAGGWLGWRLSMTLEMASLQDAIGASSASSGRASCSSRGVGEPRPSSTKGMERKTGSLPCTSYSPTCDLSRFQDISHHAMARSQSNKLVHKSDKRLGALTSPVVWKQYCLGLHWVAMECRPLGSCI